MMKDKWNKEEIEKTVKIIKEAKAKKSKAIRFLDKSLYWVFIGIVVIANLVVSILIIPILLVFKGMFLYLFVAFLGFSFGLIYEHYIKNIEGLKIKHHIFASIFIPMIAVVNIYFVTALSNELIIILMLNNEQHNIISVGLSYIVAFFVPYTYGRLNQKNL